jgi:nitroreductase / dihydropteridine reductase
MGVINLYMQQSLNQALAWRYAVNQFDTEKKISDSDLTSILEAGNLMPTAYGLQPFAFVVVSDDALKQSLVEHAYGQKHVAENSHLVVLAARTDIDENFVSEYTARIETTRGLPAGAVDGFKAVIVGDILSRSPEERIVWAKRQAFLALGGMMAAASELKIDNHALEGFNPAAFDEVLGLTKLNLTAGVILALGYRAESDQWQHYTKVRRSMDDIVVIKP